MEATAIITAVSGLGPLVTSLGDVIGRLVQSRKAKDDDIETLEKAIDSLQDSLRNVRTLADALEDYSALRLDIAQVIGLSTRLRDYVRQFQPDLRQGEASPAWQAVELLMDSLGETKRDAFRELRNKMDQGRVDSEDSGRLKEAIDNFGESYTKVVGFVETRTPAGLIGELSNMKRCSERMQDRLGKTSQKLINALRQAEKQRRVPR